MGRSEGLRVIGFVVNVFRKIGRGYGLRVKSFGFEVTTDGGMCGAKMQEIGA
jgi:hypothetical protein